MREISRKRGWNVLFACSSRSLRRWGGGNPNFGVIMNNARIEFLEGIKSLIDERIETLKKTREKTKGKKFSKIEVRD